MIRIVPDPSGEPLREAWRFGVAVGRAFELLRADTQDHVRLIQDQIGFRHCRFHGLFHDDMQVVVRGADGTLRFQWSHVAKVFDFLLSVGLTPFVELNPMPSALASGQDTFFYWRMNVTPPRAWEEWELLVQSFGEWAVRRYGSAQVRTWFFEVWNEPNLGAFWTGTREEYDELFRRSVAALKRVDPALRVGGPASAEGGWIDEFLAEHGETADFVSTHIYPMNEFATYANRDESPFGPGLYMPERLQTIRNKTGSRPLYITEWNSLDAPDRDSVDWFDNPTIDSVGSGAVTLRMGVELDKTVDGLFWWVASDVFEEAGMPQSPFSGTYGMLTVDGIPKPSFHAFQMLRMLEGRCARVSGELGAGVGAAAFGDAGCLRAVLWNHIQPDQPSSPQTTSVSAKWEGSALVSVWHVRPGQGSAYEVWRQMGRPQNPTQIQFEVLRNASAPDCRAWLSEDGSAPIQIELGDNEIVLVEWAPPGDPYIPKELLSEQSMAWNSALAAVPPISAVGASE